MSDSHRIVGGPFDGYTLRTDGDALDVYERDNRIARSPVLVRSPLRTIALAYADDHAVWAWLRAHDFVRPRMRADGRPRTVNVPEAQRHTERVNLRMLPADYARLRELAAARGGTIAQAVAWLLARASASE